MRRKNSVEFRHVDYKKIVMEAEGFHPADLHTLAERAVYQNLMRKHSSSNNLVTTEDFEQAIKEFVPNSLKGVKLEKSQVKWSDIGGS